MAFFDDVLVAGSYHGFNIYRLAGDGVPQLVSSVVCPGGQGDVSVVGDLLITSGLGGRFPPGYPVATVSTIEQDPGQAFARTRSASASSASLPSLTMWWSTTIRNTRSWKGSEDDSQQTR